MATFCRRLWLRSTVEYPFWGLLIHRVPWSGLEDGLSSWSALNSGRGRTRPHPSRGGSRTLEDGGDAGTGTGAARRSHRPLGAVHARARRRDRGGAPGRGDRLVGEAPRVLQQDLGVRRGPRVRGPRQTRGGAGDRGPHRGPRSLTSWRTAPRGRSARCPWG